jgi:hypothetical protein
LNNGGRVVKRARLHLPGNSDKLKTAPDAPLRHTVTSRYTCSILEHSACPARRRARALPMAVA